jgi:6-pyruvoyltetrahydropterin/6-carboxytetrahydropterin synthase
MNKLNLKKDFVAQHYLTVPDCGPENEWHSHHFAVEVRLVGDELNEHGYLVDIVELESAMDALIARYEDATLNDLPEFEGLNPSIEHFSRIFWQKLQTRLSEPAIDQMEVRIWEDETAWASYTE